MSVPTNPIPRPRLSMKDGAKYAGCSQRLFYDLTYSGEIPSYMAAGHRWVDQVDIDKYFARQKTHGPQFRKIGYGDGKRKPGRPKKPKPEAATASAAE
jgi:predicted DNA-binding transcriptional regulator AlpA